MCSYLDFMNEKQLYIFEWQYIIQPTFIKTDINKSYILWYLFIEAIYIDKKLSSPNNRVSLTKIDVNTIVDPYIYTLYIWRI